ncbi:MAG: signal recognition particle-docking protein FtsY [Thermoplasmata archaeon]
MFEKLKNGLKKLKDIIIKEETEEEKKESLSESVDINTSKIGFKISGKVIENALEDIEVELLESDVALDAVEAFKNNIKSDLEGKRIGIGKDREKVVELVFKESIRNSLKKCEMDFFKEIEKYPKPVVIMFVGINGSGKTTTIAKIAYMLKNKGYQSVIAAGDTFRAGAIEQISIHADKLGIKVIKHSAGADPSAVAYDAVEHAKSKGKEVVLIDTAGRMQTNVNLMEEMKKINRIVKPSLIIWVGDSLNGNDIVNQVKEFNEAVPVSGTILTKVDVDIKGGSILSVAYALQKPIYFLGTGQKYEELIPYNADWVIEHLFS